MENIVIGGGCFWCFDAAFKLVKGIIKVEQGYSGGNFENPSTEDIHYKDTGHAEVVSLTYDSSIISLQEILEIFWTLHDPTTLNRQGHDVGPEYRSIVFYNNEAQKSIIEQEKQKAQKVWEDKIVTEIAPFIKFYPATGDILDYETNRPDFCELIINPKLQKLRQKFAERINN